MLGSFAAASRRTPPVLILHCHSPGVATVARHVNVKSMSTTTTTTTTTRDRGDRYGPIEWAQKGFIQLYRTVGVASEPRRTSLWCDNALFSGEPCSCRPATEGVGSGH